MSIVSFFVNVVLLATVAIAATVVAVLIVGRIFRRVSYLVATKKLQMQNLEKSIFDELPYSIFDNIRKYMISELSIEKKYVEHELEKMKI